MALGEALGRWHTAQTINPPARYEGLNGFGPHMMGDLDVMDLELAVVLVQQLFPWMPADRAERYWRALRPDSLSSDDMFLPPFVFGFVAGAVSTRAGATTDER